MEEVKGYKAFNKDATNRYGMTFTEGNTYCVSGEIKFGVNGNGFHICTSLCDVFRYVNAKDDDVVVAEVIGSGKKVCFDDYYYGYFDMYSCEKITIMRFLDRDEIINSILNSNAFSIQKFLWTFRLNEEEKREFAKKFRNEIAIFKTLLYYQYDMKNIYENPICFDDNNLRLVINYGQNNN